MQEDLKALVREHWDNEPCGTRNITYPEGTYEYYEAISANRYRIENWIYEFAGFDQWGGKKILEVGCGTGSDLIEFARNGAIITGIDLSSKSVVLAQRRLDVYGLKGTVCEADAENMPFMDAKFDSVYSCGVLHHTPNISSAISEIHRVLKVDGDIRIILYHKPSLVCLQMYLMFGLFQLRPFRSLDYILANYLESKGTKAFTVRQTRQMFSQFRSLSIQTIVTLYDIRFARNKYFPKWCMKFIPRQFGWYILIKGKK